MKHISAPGAISMSVPGLVLARPGPILSPSQPEPRAQVGVVGWGRGRPEPGRGVHGPLGPGPSPMGPVYGPMGSGPRGISYEGTVALLFPCVTLLFPCVALLFLYAAKAAIALGEAEGRA